MCVPNKYIEYSLEMLVFQGDVYELYVYTLNLICKVEHPHIFEI